MLCKLGLCITKKIKASAIESTFHATMMAHATNTANACKRNNFVKSNVAATLIALMCIWAVNAKSVVISVLAT